ncbi:MAG: alpha/beta hydrolase fold protein [Chthonomonadaceae bacterium]|nr:alpha/beta hydrolase fold protein [Chthonomonadaceae bacterium]
MYRNALKLVGTLLFAALAFPATAQETAPTMQQEPAARINYRTVKVEGLDIFYREAGDPKKPTILLLHGFPTSSHMFRNLIPALAADFHLVAPDYPGYGNSSSPTADKFDYTFEHLTDIVEQFTQKLSLTKYAIYVQDYGAPVGFRLAVRHPERIQAIITQNGNAYEEGLTGFWNNFRDLYWKDPSAENAKPLLAFLKLEGTQMQYQAGARNKEHISPDAWIVPQYGLDRPGNQAIQLALFYDYRTNPSLYAKWHAYFRRYQPPTLIVWGKNDPIFGPEGAKAFQRDLKNSELHLLDTGHFALEEDNDEIAGYIRAFLNKQSLMTKTKQ